MLGRVRDTQYALLHFAIGADFPTVEGIASDSPTDSYQAAAKQTWCLH